MPDPHWENLKEIFHAAIALPANVRVAFLDKACRGDLSLRRAVESLLKSHEETGNFIDTPAYEAAAEMLVKGDELKADQTVGHYRILSLLGQGGMGKVSLAEDTRLHRKVSSRRQMLLRLMRLCVDWRQLMSARARLWSCVFLAD